MLPVLPDIECKPLVQAPEFLAQVAAWHHQECERQGLKSSLALRQQRLQLHVQSRAIPQTLIAVDRADVVGCVSLVTYHYRRHTDTASESSSPIWLSNLFVRESLRQRGLGTLLINAAVDYAQAIGVTELWLSAAEFTSFYQKRGWQITRRTRFGGQQVNIMRLAVEPVTMPVT